MAKPSMGTALLAGCCFLCAGTANAATPAQILQFRPKQQGISYSTPTPEEQERCKVKWQKTPEGGVWLLFDPQGRILRRLVDTKGDDKPHVWCYYHEGIEVYREIEGEPNQYRWLNAGGMKWGVDFNKDQKVDSWRMISAEEVGQEILQALVSRDFSRIQALFISQAEIDSLALPTAEAARIRDLQKQAYNKFQNTVARLPNLSAKTRWVHLETAPPQCLPVDTYGAKQDIIKYARATILCETDGKHDWIQTGEMIKLGLAWRIIDAPTAGDGTSEEAPSGGDPELQALLTQLGALDAKPPRANELGTGPNPELVTYNLKRADLLERIVAKVKPEERDQWIRQVADCLAAAAQSSSDGDKTAYNRLTALEEQIVKPMPGSNLAAYITFREMSAENAILLKTGTDNAKVQDKWLERLAKFVETYPKADDTAEALMQLGMFSELVNKEIEAKKWYKKLVGELADHQLAAKAQGALRRLEVEGQALELTGTQFDGSPFHLADLRGKVVVVYYWGGWSKERCVGDFATLKMLLDTYPGKLAVVCVNLDNTVDEAKAFLQRVPSPGIQLFQAGGLDSPLASQYGIMFLPHLFLVDKDGTVISRTLQQVSSLDDELKKRLK
jgi:Thioredoxin-like